MCDVLSSGKSSDCLDSGSMAKKAAKSGAGVPAGVRRLTVNIPMDVWRFFHRVELHETTTKTRLVVAGICAMRAMDEREREALLQWATMFDDEAASWADYEKTCDMSGPERQKALRSLLEKAIAREPAHSPGQQKVSVAGESPVDRKGL